MWKRRLGGRNRPQTIRNDQNRSQNGSSDKNGDGDKDSQSPNVFLQSTLWIASWLLWMTSNLFQGVSILLVFIGVLYGAPALTFLC